MKKYVILKLYISRPIKNVGLNVYTSARELEEEWKSKICRLIGISLLYADHNDPLK